MRIKYFLKTKEKRLKMEVWYTVLITSEIHITETYKMTSANTPLVLVRWSLGKKFPENDRNNTKLPGKRRKVERTEREGEVREQGRGRKAG